MLPHLRLGRRRLGASAPGTAHLGAPRSPAVLTRNTPDAADVPRFLGSLARLVVCILALGCCPFAAAGAEVEGALEVPHVLAVGVSLEVFWAHCDAGV